jgi:hypothetical protein
MNILTKTDMGDSKKNYFADTAPDTKTYDIDKMVAKRKATKHIGLSNNVYEHNGIVYNSYTEYRNACIEEFLVTFPPNFLRKEYPSSVLIDETSISWNKDWIQSIYMTDQWHYFTKKLELAICKWFIGDGVDVSMMDSTDMGKVLNEALTSIYEKLNNVEEKIEEEK